MYKVKIFVDYPEEKNIEAAVPEGPMPISQVLQWIQRLVATEQDMTAFRVETEVLKG